MKPAANFDPVARWYCWLEYAAFGRALERCRFALLPALEDAQRVLILGEGDGRFLKKLLSINATARIDVIEASAGMMKLARGRLSNEEARRVKFHLADARNWDFPEAEYDAIVTCFFLDCFTPKTLADLMPRITASAKPGACWLLSEFEAPSTARSRVWLALMHAFFRVATNLEASQLSPFAELIAESGWENTCRVTFAGGLMSSGIWRTTFSPKLRENCGLISLVNLSVDS